MSDDTHNDIAGTLLSSSGIESLRSITAEPGTDTRSALAGRVCEYFNFVDRRGAYRISRCLTVLKRLEKEGYIQLPQPRSRGGWKRSPRGTGEAPASPVNVPDQAGQVSGLSLQLVKNEQDRRTWNELLMREHPQGERIITGRQLRYLVTSDHGLLGAIGVSSAALHLQARDDWIGWDWESRRKYLERVICLSRFLIRPATQCRNLASRVLGRFCRRVSADFNAIYGYKTILEPHRQRTIKRMRNEKRVRCAQDSSVLDYSSLKNRTEGRISMAYFYPGLRTSGPAVARYAACQRNGQRRGYFRITCVNIQRPEHKEHLDNTAILLYAIYAYEPAPPPKTATITSG